MESYNDRLRKRIQGGAQADLQDKVYTVSQGPTPDLVKLAVIRGHQQVLDPKFRSQRNTVCNDGEPGQDGAQVTCDGQCHAYFA